MKTQQAPQPVRTTRSAGRPWLSVAFAATLIVVAGAPADAGCPLDVGNDSFRSATTVGATTISMAIDCAGDVDYYSFTAAEAGEYDFMVSDTDASRLTLIDWDGNEAVGSYHLARELRDGEQVFLRIEAKEEGEVFPYLLSIASPIADCGTDPGNDSTGTATPNSQCGYIGAAMDCALDLDYYGFQAPTSGTYTWALNSNNKGGLVLYADDGQTELDAGWSSVTYSAVAGDYLYIVVSARNGSDIFDYELATGGCTSCGADPGNEFLAEAIEIEDCGTILAAMDCAGDQDYYYFVPTDSADHTFETTGSVDTQMRLYDSNGDVIADDDDGGAGYNSKITHPLVGGQKYSVALNEYLNDDTGRYDLVLSGCDAGCGNDPGNDYFADATPVASCTNVPADIDCVGDVDFYKFTAPNSGDFVFLTASSIDTEMRLYDPDGNVIASDDNSGSGLNARIEHFLSEGTIYRVAVNEKGADGTGAYQLEISGCDVGCGTDPGNDYFADATPVLSCINVPADIDCTGDVDFYSFVAPNAGEFSFLTVSSLDTEMRLYDPDGNVIATDDDSGYILNARIDYTLVSGLNYRVAVNEKGYDDIGAYQLEIGGCMGGCGTDPGNDTAGTATPVASCTNVPADIDCVGDLDFYSFVAPNSGGFVFLTTGATDTYLRLYDGAGSLIAWDDNSGTGNNARIGYSLTSGVTYLVLVSEKDDDGTGAYQLEITGCSGGGGCGSDPGNDTAATATSVASCTNVPADIDCVGDIDFYSFVAPNSGGFVFLTTGATDTHLTLYDGAGSLIASDDNSGTGNNARIAYTLTSGVNYRILVRESGDDATGAYQLEITGCSGGGCGNDPGNDTLADATLIPTCTNAPADIDCLADVDYYRFVPPNSGSFIFQTTGSLDTEMKLYDGNGVEIASDDDSGPDYNSRIEHTLTAGINYRVRVNEYGNNGTGAYQLEITGCTTTISCTAQATELNIQSGRFKISGAAFLNDQPSTFFLQNLCTEVAVSNTAAAFYFNDNTAPVQEGFVSIRNICNGGAQAYVVEVASASTRRFWIDVQDTQTGLQHRYENASGGTSSFFPADTQSFAGSCPKSAAPEIPVVLPRDFPNPWHTGDEVLDDLMASTSATTCVAKDGQLFLQNGRFKISGAAFLNGNPSTFFLQNLCAGGIVSNTASAFFFNDNTAPVQEGFVSVRNICNGGAQAFVVEVASASTRRFWIDVEDTWKGITKRYENTSGGTSAFFPADRTTFQDSCNP